MRSGGARAAEGLQKTGERVQEGARKGERMAASGDEPVVQKKVKEQAKGMLQAMRDKSPLNTNQVLGLITILTGGTVLVVGGGLAIAGTIATIIISTPFLILASPVLIPIGITLFLATAGFLTAGAVFLAFVSAVSWLYRYLKGRRSPRHDELEAARQRLIETASQVQERAREYGSNMSGLLTREAAPGA